MKQVTAILLGAGQRGADVYANYALRYPNELKMVGVAEPRKERREEFAVLHQIPCKNCAETWEDILKRDKFADCVFVCTQDRMHYEPVVQALRKGYHVLCEKPMSHDREELLQMNRVAKETGKALSICHVLRYSPFFVKIRELLDSEAIGQLVTIQHIESIGYWHMAHSFVRGNWRNSEETSPIILAKCCHDLDILRWLVGCKVKQVSSFGSLAHFNRQNRPEGAPDRCMDGCAYRDTCPYYAPKFYLDHPKAMTDGFSRTVSIDTSTDKILAALKTGPYGRCVYACDNNVADNQVVNLMYENGVTASMTMCAFTERCERIINLMGSRGQIRGNMENNIIEISDFVTGNISTIHLHTPAGGHSGSDASMMKDFIGMVASGATTSRSSSDASVESHLTALAAEESRRKKGMPVYFD